MINHHRGRAFVEFRNKLGTESCEDDNGNGEQRERRDQDHPAHAQGGIQCRRIEVFGETNQKVVIGMFARSMRGTP